MTEEEPRDDTVVRKPAGPTVRDAEDGRGHVRPFLGVVNHAATEAGADAPPARPASARREPEARESERRESEPPARASRRSPARASASGRPTRPSQQREPVGEPQPAERDAPRPAGAEEFTDSRMLRTPPALAQRGWRRWVNVLSGGLLKLGRSPAEQRDAERMARLTTPIAGSRRVLVLSRKGGVGKTTVTLMLGHTFASLRGDRVVALDGDPDGGSLGYRVRRETSANMKSLLDDAGNLERYASMRGYTSQASTRLEVVAAHDDPSISEALGHADHQQAIRLLDKHYNLILLDSGAGILDGATQGMLELADQLIVVLAPSLDAARAASMTLDWLDEHGYGDLVSGAVAVFNQVRDRTPIERKTMEEHFTRRCRAAVRIPWDPGLESGGQTALEDLRPVTREAYVDLAAAVADGFPLGRRRAG